MPKLVSLLIPTRKRPESLLACINSFISLSSNMDDVEIIIRVDEDDVDTLALHLSHVTVIKGKRPDKGYAGLHHLYNELYDRASGTYLWVLNDDVRMTTLDWDFYIKSLRNVLCIAHPKHGEIGGNLFPIIHRKLVEIQGFFALYASIDIQYEQVVKGFPELHKYISIHATHVNVGRRQHDIDEFPPYPAHGDATTDVMFAEGMNNLAAFLQLNK